MSRLSNYATRWWLVAAVLMLIGLMVATFLALGIHVFRVAGGSMEPTLPSGSVVITMATDDLAERDIITYREPGSGDITTHTFIGYDDGGSLMTKGDANVTPDVFMKPLVADDVIGKVVLMSPLLAPSFWLSLRGVAAIAALAVLAWVFLSSSSSREMDEQSEDDFSLLNPA